jgi:hypothetical protein
VARLGLGVGRLGVGVVHGEVRVVDHVVHALGLGLEVALGGGEGGRGGGGGGGVSAGPGRSGGCFGLRVHAKGGKCMRWEFAPG